MDWRLSLFVLFTQCSPKGDIGCQARHVVECESAACIDDSPVISLCHYIRESVTRLFCIVYGPNEQRQNYEYEERRTDILNPFNFLNSVISNPTYKCNEKEEADELSYYYSIISRQGNHF